jgi:hypothetical protein
MSKPSTADAVPNRDKLGPTGPLEKPANSRKSYDEKHPNAGNIAGRPTEVRGYHARLARLKGSDKIKVA